MLWLVCFGLAGTVAAQEDPMEVQRCVWSCLANSPGVQSHEYHQCVERFCVAPRGEADQSPLPVQSDWGSGVATDGRHQFAGTQAEQGYGLYYFCFAGQSFLTLSELPLPPGQYRMLIGTTEYIVPFDMTRGALSVNVPPVSPFMAALRTGGEWATLRSMAGEHLIRFSLRGADAHIGRAVSACFG
ncbi:hypothetical protein AB2B41_14250 [Marimonas sp. MJW-29]|uniref:Uncharacterized protein n=1 Tax=Sulfitobacter sediminis TaxID=3234186 RepID=A0ABV3RRV4_9RHOB